MYIASLKRSENYKAQPYQYASSSKQILKAKAKPFPPCTHYGFNDHRLDIVETTLSVEFVEAMITLPQHTIVSFRSEEEYISEPIWYLDSGCSRSMTGVKSYLHKYVEQPGLKVVFGDNSSCIIEGYGSINLSPMSINHEKYTLVIVDEYTRERILDISYFYVCGCLVFIHNHKDHLGKFDAKTDDGYFLGYSSVSKAFRVYNIRRQQIEETYHVTFDEIIEAIRFTNTSVDEIGIDDSSRYPPDEFLQEDDPFRQYQVDSDVSYYIIPHGCSLTELTQ
ncbi:retrovirus-related pol polyprotein from transposon TNT 1-94 [Tanacetum coccineum]